MSKYQGGTLATLDAQEDGAAINVTQLEEIYYHVYGTFVGTWKLQGAYNESGAAVWVDLDTGTAAKVPTKLGSPVAKLRAICSAWTSGTISVAYAGRDADR